MIWETNLLLHLILPIFINIKYLLYSRASLVAQAVKNLPVTQETWVLSLVWEDSPEKETATHSNILAWRIPWAEESGRLQYMVPQRAGHDWTTFTSVHLWSRQGFQGGSDGKESACSVGDPGLTPKSGREGDGYTLQYSWLENSMDRGTWWATVNGLTRVGHDLVNNTHTHPHTHTHTHTFKTTRLPVCMNKQNNSMSLDEYNVKNLSPQIQHDALLTYC